MLLIPPLMRQAKRWQFVDLPDQRKVHAEAIPRIGGVAMVLGAVMPIIMWLTLERSVMALLLGISVILFFGVWDDRRNLDYKTKFLGQTIAVLIVVIYGGIRIDYIPFYGLEPIPTFISLPLTIVFLLGITNAINLADGLDGLAGGTSLLSFGVMAVLGYLDKNAIVLITSIAVLGSILGFLRFNTHPARIFMGDGGSQFLGFSLGVLSLLLTQQQQSPFSAALPLLLLGLPILDTLMVMGQRIYAKRSPFAPDRNHIHHKLLALGFDHYEAVFAIYASQAFLVVSAYLLRFQSDAVIVLVYALFCVVIIGFFRFTHATKWKFRTGEEGAESRLSLARGVKLFRRYRIEGKIIQWTSNTALWTLPVFLLTGVFTAEQISLDIGLLSLAVCAVSVVPLFNRDEKVKLWLTRTGAYVICTLVAYLYHTQNDLSQWLSSAMIVYTALLAIIVAVDFRFSNQNSFRPTTLDFLVLFGAFTIPNLPGNSIGWQFSSAIAQIVVMFYVIEMIVSNTNNNGSVLRYIIAAVAGILALKAFVG
jgi:UDP-GlcNAc:undecaprenyl-phosphate GlcNAc-1-phosphate transferase